MITGCPRSDKRSGFDQNSKIARIDRKPLCRHLDLILILGQQVLNYDDSV